MVSGRGEEEVGGVDGTRTNPGVPRSGMLVG